MKKHINLFNCNKIKISKTQTEEYQYEWRIPASAIEPTVINWNKTMLTYTGGTFTSDPSTDTVYYAEKPPIE